MFATLANKRKIEEVTSAKDDVAPGEIMPLASSLMAMPSSGFCSTSKFHKHTCKLIRFSVPLKPAKSSSVRGAITFFAQLNIVVSGSVLAGGHLADHAELGSRYCSWLCGVRKQAAYSQIASCETKGSRSASSDLLLLWSYTNPGSSCQLIAAEFAAGQVPLRKRFLRLQAGLLKARGQCQVRWYKAMVTQLRGGAECPVSTLTCVCLSQGTRALQRRARSV